MRFLKAIIYFLSIVQMLTVAYAAQKIKAQTRPSTAFCSADEIAKFKTEYVKLQNALKYEGKDIELRNGKSFPKEKLP
jgi:hypothetical protein